MNKIIIKDGTEIYYKDWGTGQVLFFIMVGLYLAMTGMHK
jgi:hypothetical protein